MKLNKISIIIPAGKNREDKINNLLESIKEAKYGDEISEINIICDKDVKFNEINKKLNIKIYPSKKKINIPEARNLGIKKSTKKWLLFIDSDCVVPKNFFEILKKCSGKIIVGNFKPFKKSLWSVLQYKQDIETLSRYIHKNKIDVLSCYFFIEKDTFKKIGFFDPKIPISDEREWATRAIKKGYKINYNKNLIIFHDYHGSIFKAVKRRFWHGTGYPALAKKDPAGRKTFFSWMKYYSSALSKFKKDPIFSLFLVLEILAFHIGYVLGIIKIKFFSLKD